MTVAPVNTETSYALTGSSLGPFNTVWPYQVPSDVVANIFYTSGLQQGLTQGSDYILTPNNPPLSAGGYVTLASYLLNPYGGTWPAGTTITLQRVSSRDQPSSFGEAVGFSPQASEQALDHVERQVQELGVIIGRTLRLDPGTPQIPAMSLAPRTLWATDANSNFLAWSYGNANILIGTDANGDLMDYSAYWMVTTFNSRRGDVTLGLGDVIGAGGAPINSPNFTGNPLAPTPVVGDSSGAIATTSFVARAVANGVAGAVTSFNGRTGGVTLTTADVTGAGGAPLASPNFTGLPAGPTAAPGTSTLQLATTAFVGAAVAGAVTSFNGRTGAVALQLADVTGAGGAPLASPNFSGTPTAPTQPPGTNNTDIATCAFVAASVAGGTAGVASFNNRTGQVTLTSADVSGASGLLTTGGTLTGDLWLTYAAPTLNLNKTTATNICYVTGKSNGNNRWSVNLGDATAETGSNAGSNFSVASYTDAGAYLATPFQIDRPTGAVTFTGTVVKVVAPNPYLEIRKTVASNGCNLIGTNNGSTRFTVLLGDGTAESGSNAGSNFVIQAYNDAGTILSTPLNITRANGLATFGAAVTANAPISVNGPAGSQRAHQMLTSGVGRWSIIADQTAETGSNAGSNCQFLALNDAGAWLVTPLVMTRATGVCTFSQPIVNGSDFRQKRDVTPLGDALALVKQLAGVSYERINRPGRREIGLIAQDVRAVLPEAVEECIESDAEDAVRIGTDDEPLLGVSYTQFTALLIEAVKTLAARVETLEAAR